MTAGLLWTGAMSIHRKKSVMILRFLRNGGNIMSLIEYIKLYLAVKEDCKRRYKRDIKDRMRELMDAYRIQ